VARIAGVNLPTNKRVVIALQYIHGIGQKIAQDIMSKVNLPAERRVSQLTDAVRSQGGKPANYAEIGGNPSVAKSCGLAKEVLKKDGVEKIAVMMSIVSNTRVDIVARGVIKACLELGKDPAETIAIFRIPGAWEEEGFKILDRYGVEYCDRSVSMWEAAGRAVSKIQGANT